MACAVKREYWNALDAGDLNNIFSDKNVQELLAVTIDAPIAIKILKLLTRAIVQNCKNDFRYYNNIQTTAKYLLENGYKEPYNSDVSVLSCVYYISKYFLDKGKMEMALELKPYFKNFEGEKTGNVLKTFYCYFFELFNFLKSNKSLSADSALNIRYESLEVLSYCSVNYLQIIFSEANLLVCGKQIRENFPKNNLYAIRVLKTTKNILDYHVISEHCEVVCRHYSQFVANLILTILGDQNRDMNMIVEVLDNVVVIQTSKESCNKIISFFVKALRGVLKSELPLASIKQQILVLQDLIRHESNSLLFSLCYQFSNVYFSVHGYWLSTMTAPFSLQEYLITSELALCLSSVLRRNIHQQNSQIEPSSIASLSFKVIINFISLGINYFLNCEHCSSDVNNSNDNVQMIFKQLSVIYTHCFELIFVLKDYDGLVWKDLWKVFEMRSVKLASVLEYKGYYELACEILQKFCCEYFDLEPLLKESTSSEECIYKAFKCLCQCLVHQNKYEEALTYIGIAVLFLSSDTTSFQKIWIMAKTESVSKQNNKLQNISMTSILLKQKLKSIIPSIHSRILERLDSPTISRVLLWELESYMVDRLKMYDAICAVSRELVKSPSSTLTFCEGCEISLSSMWMKYDESKAEFSVLYDAGIKVLLELEKKTCDDDKSYIFFLLGNMHYYGFFAEVTAHRKKLQEDVNSMKEKLPSKIKRSVMKGLIDPTETEMKSNIFTVFEDLNVEKEQEFIRILLKALDAWTNVPLYNINPLQINQHKMDSLLVNIKTAANAFALYGYNVHSLKTWMICYQISKSSGNAVDTLHAISQLLSFSNNKQDHDLWKEANKIEVQIQNNDLDSKGKEILFYYFLSKSKSYLMNNECDLGWQYLQKINEASISKTFGAQLIFAQKNLLFSKYFLHRLDFLKLPDDFEDYDSFICMIKSLKILKTLYQLRTLDSVFENCNLHLIMMQAIEWVGNLCFGLKLYRDGYAHLKHYLTLAQILGLASRCSEIVSKLAQFDILCHEVQNAEVKLLGLEAILCLKNMPLPFFYKIDTHHKEENLKEYNTPSSDAERTKLLDVPTPARRMNHMASPELQKSPFKMPSVIAHQESCTCLFCSSVLFHSALVELTFMNAQLHVLNGEHDLASSFFRGGVKLGEKLKLMQKKILDDLKKKIYGNDSICNFSLSDNLLMNLSRLFMYYAEFLYFSSHYGQMQQMIENSRKCLLELQEPNLHLALDIIDRAQILYLELNNIPSEDDGACKSNICKITDVEENLQTLTPRITKTPVSYKTICTQVPKLHRNEDHMYLPITVSPSMVANLDSKLEDEGKTPAKREEITSTSKNSESTIDFNDSSVISNIHEFCESKMDTKRNLRKARAASRSCRSVILATSPKR